MTVVGLWAKHWGCNMASPKDRVNKILAEVAGVTAQYGISNWEANFLASIRDRAFLSDKQEKTLVEIEVKVFEREDDDEDDGTEDGVQRTDDRFHRGY